MRQVNISGVDLNLLAPLAALLDERHVSRAADAAGMSQPAMSRALRRLRDAFDDELLVRTAGGYRLTPRAERLQRDLAQTLPRLESLLSEEPFDPRTAANSYRIASTDYVVSVVGPTLLREALALSPRSRFTFAGWHEGVYEDVERGAIDLAFTSGVAPPPLRSESLFEDRYVCLVSPHSRLHPKARFSLDRYLSCDHAVVDIAGGKQAALDIRLEALGRARRAAVTVPYHAFGAAAVGETDLVATLPRRFVEGLALDRSLRVVAAPPELEPVSFAMAWHPRLDEDPGQSWLRDTVRSTAPH